MNMSEASEQTTERRGPLHELLSKSIGSCMAGGNEIERTKFAESLTKDSLPQMDDLPPSQSATVADTMSETSNNSVVIDSDDDCSNNPDPSTKLVDCAQIPPVVEASQDQSFLAESSVSSAEEVLLDPLDAEAEASASPSKHSFFLFRMSYLVVTLVIMLADGLQGMYNGFLSWD